MVSIAMFLGDNGHQFKPDPVDAYRVTMALAAGEISVEELANWIMSNSRPTA